MNGRILDAIPSLYVNAPTLFYVYMNDLAQEINGLNCGINVGDIMVSTHLYADNTILIAPSDENLQQMFDTLTLTIWCIEMGTDS